MMFMNKKITIYHGSDHVIEELTFGKGKKIMTLV